MVTTSTDAAKGTESDMGALPELTHLRADKAHLCAMVAQELWSNVTEMTGSFALMRQLPTFAEQMVSQYLDFLDGRLTPAEMQTQQDVWVTSGMGPEGAYAVIDVLYRAGADYQSESLKPILDEYRRKFTIGYQVGRRAESLGEYERMQTRSYSALEKQIASEHDVKLALLRRQSQLETAAELARVIGPLRDVNDLLATACRYLQERLDLAFASVYLLDEFRQRAILRAGTGAAGQDLLVRGHQTPLAEFSPLSRALNENHLVFLKDGTDTQQPYAHPLLPATAMAVVIPLNAHGKILGFWTAHTDNPGAFTAQDTAVLTLIGDNLAYAIENAELFAKAHAGLAELERAQGTYLRQAWASDLLSREMVYSQTQDGFATPNGAANHMPTLESTNGDAPHSMLSVPITLRGQVIGTVDLMDVTQPRTWSQEEQALAASVVEQMALAVENARLFDQAQQRTQELTAINEITNVISEQLELEHLLAQVHAQVQRVMSADAFFVSLYDDVTDTIAYPYVFDDGKRHASPGNRLAPGGSSRRVIDSGKGLLINRTPQEMAEVKAALNAETAMGDPSKASASLLYAPLRRNDRIVGIISAQSYTPNAYQERDLELLEGIGIHVAVALQNARLFEATQQREQETALINEMARELSGELDQDRLFAKVYPYLKRLMPTDAFVVWFYDEASHTITRPVLYDLDVRYPPELKPLVLTERMERILETNAPLAVNLTRQQWEAERVKLSAIFGSSEASASLLYVPLRVGSSIRGFVSVQSYQFNAYDEPQIALLTSVSNYVATALENAQLFAETTAALQETQTLYNIGARLNQVTSLEDLVRIAAQPAFDQGAGSAQLLLMEYLDQEKPIAANVIVSLVFPGDPAPLSPYTHFPIEQFGLGQAMLSNPRDLIMIDDVETSPLLDEQTRQVLLASRDHAVVMLPLTVDRRVLGAIAIGWGEPHTFDARERRIYQALSSELALVLNNRLLFDQTQAALEETRTLYETSARLNAANTLQEALDAAAKQALDTGAHFAALFAINLDAADVPRTMTLQASTGPAKAHSIPIGTNMPIMGSQFSNAWTQNPNEPVFVQDIDTDKRLTDTERNNFHKSRVKSTAILPLYMGGRWAGMLGLNWAEEHVFTDPEQRLYRSIMSQAATVLDNRRLFEQTQEALAETQTLYEISARLNASNSIQEALEAAAGPAIVQGAHTASLLRIFTGADNEPTELEFAALWPRNSSLAIPLGTRFSSEFLAGDSSWVENPYEPVLVENILTDPRVNEMGKASYASTAIQATALLPMKIGDRWIGVLNFNWQAPRSFSPRDVRLYRSLMAQASTVLDNRALFEQTQNALALTENLYNASQRLSASETLQELVASVAESVNIPAINRGVLMILERDAQGELESMYVGANWSSGHGNPPTAVGTRYPRQIFQAIPIVLGQNVSFVDDVPNEVRLDAMSRALFERQEILSVALMPLWVGNEQRGSLLLETQEPHVFTEKESRALISLAPQLAITIENRRLFEATQTALAQTQTALTQVQEAQDRLNLQYQTANILARANSFEQAAPLLLENVCRSLNWQMGEYWAIDENTNRLMLTHLWNEPSVALVDFAADSYGITFGPGEGLAGRTWMDGRPIWVPNVYDDPGFKQQGKAQAAGLVSALAFPLQSETRQFGVTVFFSNYTQPMDDTLMATMVGVGSQIGQYLERRRAEEAVRQQNTYLTALHDTTLGLMRRLDLDELLQNIITRAAELVGTEHGYVHLIEPSGTELRMRVGIGIYQDFIGTRVKPGQGLAGTVWRNNEPIIVDDYRYWQGRLPMVDRDVLRAVAGVPLKSGTQTVGVLGLASLEEGRKFGAAQIEALDRFAELAAVALDNAQLYNASQNALEQTQRLAQREKAGSEIADKLYAASDVNSVLRTAAEELRRNTGSRRAIVRLNVTPQDAPAHDNGDK